MKNLKTYLKEFAGNKVLMAVYPHPDDETMAAGGLLIEAKTLGFETVVVCLTKGEAGLNFAPERGKELAEIRETELSKALEILKVNHFELGDFGDGKLRGGEQFWKPWVDAQLKKYSPGVVVGYDHSGIYGHPDHIALSLSLSWPVLFWTTLSKKRAMELPFTKEVREVMTVPTHFLEIDLVKKQTAAKAHRSQKLNEDKLPAREWYHQVGTLEKYPFKFLNKTF